MSDVDEEALRKKISAWVAVGFFVIFALLLSFGLTALPQNLLPPWIRIAIWILGVGLFGIATYHAYFHQVKQDTVTD